jgi:Fe-S cluster assembly protein SufD
MNVQNYLIKADQYIEGAPLSAMWAEEIRKKSLDAFKKSGFPGKKEAYRFTNIEKFLSVAEWQTPKHTTANDSVALALESQSQYDNLVVFINGTLSKEYSRQKSPLADLVVEPVAQGLETEEKTWKGFTNFKDDELTHLHHAFLGEGIVIHAKKNAKTSLKVLSFITDENIFSHPTILVKTEKFADLTLFEECYSLNEKIYSQQFFTLVQVEAGAKVEHIQLVHENNTTNYLNTTEAKIQKDGVYRNVTLHLGAAMSRKNLAIELLESGAHAESFALYGLKGKQHSDISTQILHKAADTTSAQIAKGILADESRGVFTGKIHIFQEAQRVNSSQLNKNLLLSSKAQAHSQPQLEIFADDVKCSHGSTTGQLQDDELFYFQSRGIPADKARALLAHAFGNEILMKIENKQMREEINDRVLREFETHIGQ